MQRSLNQRSRSAKPTTIHGYAQSGDLLGFQKLLRENPSLLNERNPVVRSHSILLCPFGFFKFHSFFPKRLYFDVALLMFSFSGYNFIWWVWCFFFRIIKLFYELGFVVFTIWDSISVLCFIRTALLDLVY